MSATQKIALITGVSREMGLGFETARQLGAYNFKVIITARDLEKATELAGILSGENLDVTAMELDVLSDDSVAQLTKSMEQQYGKLDVLINNAGGFFDGGANALDTDFAFMQQVLDTNLFGAWRMVKHLVPLLKNSGAGIIVNVSSGAGSFADPDFGLIAKADTPAYGISKLALNGLTVKLANHLKASGIKVNAVCPGFTATYPGTEQWGARPVADGAKGVVWAALLPDDGPTGGFFRDGKPLGW